MIYPAPDLHIDPELGMEFIKQSNFIENERQDTAHEDAMLALQYAKIFAFRLGTTSYALDIHRILLHRKNKQIAGKFRECAVMIGGRTCPFISVAALSHSLNDIMCAIERDIQRNPNRTDFKKEEACKRLHVQFEHLHPFEDGNGRTGRIIYNIHRLLVGLPLHVIHEGKEQQEYYKWF